MVLLAGILFSACGSPPKKAGESCTKNSDCEKALVCLNQVCKQAIPKTDIKTPTADIIGPTRVKVGSKVNLDGSRSIGYSGSPLSYTWKLTAPDGSKASLSDTQTSQVTFTADVPGKYALSLMVKDQDKESQEATFEVEAFEANVPPEAKVKPAEATVKAGEAIELDGSESSDADKDKLNFSWTLKSKPDGSKADLSSTDQDKTSLTPDEAGLYVVELEVDDGNGGKATAQSFITATKEPEAPKLTSLKPESAPAGITTKVILEGENFLFGATVQFDGKDVKSTDYINDKRLEIQLDLTKAAKGKYKIKVINPDKKKQESNEMEFEVTEPQAPKITQVGPPLVVTGQQVRLVIDGSGFLPGAVVAFDGNDLSTDFESDKLLRATLTVPKDGTYKIIATNPDGQKSNEYEFTVSSVTPLIDSISFSRIGNDCAKESIIVKGRNLLPGVQAELVLKSDPKKTYAPTKTDYVSMTEIKLEFDFTKVPKGAYNLTVTNAGSEAKSIRDFNVTDPLGDPKVYSVAPTQLLVKTNATFYLTGINLDGASVTLDGKTLTPVKLNSSLYRVNVDLNSASPGKVKLEIAGLCGKKASPVDVEYVEIATPTLESAVPSTITLATTGDVLLRGSGFHPNAKVLNGGSAVTTAVFIHGGLFKVPVSSFKSAGNYDIEIENPGSKKSKKLVVKVDHTPVIESMDPSALVAGATGNVTINGKNFDPKAKVFANSTPLTGVTVKDSEEITVPASSFSSGGDYDIEVENPGGQKSAKYKFKVYNTGSMVLVRYEWGGLVYFHGVGIRTTTSTSDSTVVVYKGATQVFSKKATNSAVYNDAVYLSPGDFSSLTSPPYEVQICRPVNGGTCSNKLAFIPGQSSGSTGTSGPSIPKQELLPTIAAIEPGTPKAFIKPTTNPPTKLTFTISGNFFESGSKVYINGKDIANITGAKATISAVGSIQITDLPVSELVTGDNSIEVVTSVGRSNTQYLNWSTAPRMRIVWANYLFLPSDVRFVFSLYGAGFDLNSTLVSGGKTLQSGSGNLKWSSFSSDPPSSIYSLTWDDAKKLTPGVIDLRVELSNGTKSNTIQMRAIDPGNYGKEPLFLASLDGESTFKNEAGAAPYVGEEFVLRLGVSGFIAKGGGLGGQGKVVLEGKPTTDYTAGVTSTTTSITSSSYLAGYTYVTLKKQNLGGAPRVVSVHLENPDGKKSNEHMVTVMPQGAARLTRLETANYYYNIIRPGQENLVRVYGNGIKNAKFYLAGLPVELDRYSSSSSSGYEYANIKIDVPDWPAGFYPLWAQKGTTVTNTLLVQVRKEGVGGVPRVTAIVPLVLNKNALSKTNNKVRIAFTGRGFTKTTKVVFNSKSYPIIFNSSSLSFAELDMSGLNAGKYKIHFEDDNGASKSHEFQIEID